MELNFLMFSGLNLSTSVKYLTIKEFPSQPIGEFLSLRVSIFNTDGFTCEIVMDVKLAVKLFVTMKIAKNHGVSTTRAKGLLIGSPAY